MPEFKVVTRKTITNTFCLVEGESLEAVRAYWQECAVYFNSVDRNEIFNPHLNSITRENFELVSVEESDDTALRVSMRGAVEEKKERLKAKQEPDA